MRKGTLQKLMLPVSARNPLFITVCPELFTPCTYLSSRLTGANLRLSEHGIELAHDCLTHDVFLKLRLGVLVDDRGPAAQGVFGQRHRDFLIHPRRNRPRGSLAILGPRLSAGAFGIGFWVTLGEWSSLARKQLRPTNG